METSDLAMGDEGEGSAESAVVGGGEEEEEIYKCDNCEAAFTSIADFMDHRNFDCECGEELDLIFQSSGLFLLKSIHPLWKILEERSTRECGSQMDLLLW